MPTPDPEVIDLLERWLEAAQRGALQDVVLVGRFADGECVQDWQIAEEHMDDIVLETRTTVILMQTVKDDIGSITEH